MTSLDIPSITIKENTAFQKQGTPEKKTLHNLFRGTKKTREPSRPLRHTHTECVCTFSFSKLRMYPTYRQKDQTFLCSFFLTKSFSKIKYGGFVRLFYLNSNL